jgi:hypothetical protein
LNTSNVCLEKLIDPRYAAENSIVLRYRNTFTFGTTDGEDARFKECLEKTSIREGARIFPLLSYKGVDIHVLDETSLMHTGTLKSIDGCVTTAKCKLKGYERIVFESGANTGMALTAYGSRAGLETFFFVPEENLPLLDRKIFRSPATHLISVEDPGLVKRAARLFARLYGLKHVPETAWRYEASGFRGCFVLEHILAQGRFDWITQTISAAFGPIGIYSILKQFKQQAGVPPQFLGIQQQANCPMYRAWKSLAPTPTPVPIRSTSQLLTKAMYDFAPHTYGTYQDLKDLLVASRGDLTTINHREFSDLLERDFDGKGILQLLSDHGIKIGREVVEKTGLMAVAGTLKEIDHATIPRGSKILCCLTSGISSADVLAKPERRISSLKPQEALHGGND